MIKWIITFLIGLTFGYQSLTLLHNGNIIAYHTKFKIIKTENNYIKFYDFAEDEMIIWSGNYLWTKECLLEE